MSTIKEATVVSAGSGLPMNVMGHAVTLKLTSQQTAGEYYVFEVLSPGRGRHSTACPRVRR